MRDFQKLDSIANRNGDIVLSPLSNIKNITTGKNGWGSITIALPNEWAIKLLSEEVVGGLYLTTKDEWSKEVSDAEN